MNRKDLIISLMLVMVLFISTPLLAEPRYGGTIRVGLQSDSVPTLDLHQTGVTISYHVGWHIFETLFTLDQQYGVIPMLAKSYEADAQGLTYTIYLRENVPFHNGKNMTAEDVIASLKRWGDLSGVGTRMFNNIVTIESSDPYTVTITLEEPIGTFMVNLAIPNQGAYIYPKEVIDKFGKDHIEDYIGTGPFMFQEWIPGRHLILVRFPDYAPVDFPASGYGGEKISYLDKIIFMPMPDSTVRAAAVEVGSVHQSDFAPTIEYERLKNDPDVNTWLAGPRGFDAFSVNTKSPLLADLRIRQALLAATDAEAISKIRYDHPDIWRLCPSIMLNETIWYSEASAHLYNQNNPERARQLLAEAGYDGTPVKLMISTGRQEHGLTFKHQLQAAGFVVDDIIVEWATLVERRSNPDLWDLFTTGFTWRVDPTQMAFLSPSFPGWWENPMKEELVDLLDREHVFEKRYEYWDQIQELIYQDVPIIKLADYSTFRITHASLKNYQNMIDIFFWNTWLDE